MAYKTPENALKSNQIYSVVVAFSVIMRTDGSFYRNRYHDTVAG